jgi:hypothetical protein
MRPAPTCSHLRSDPIRILDQLALDRRTHGADRSTGELVARDCPGNDWDRRIGLLSRSDDLIA